jgi:hypothetical protein
VDITVIPGGSESSSTETLLECSASSRMEKTGGGSESSSDGIVSLVEAKSFLKDLLEKCQHNILFNNIKFKMDLSHFSK